MGIKNWIQYILQTIWKVYLRHSTSPWFWLEKANFLSTPWQSMQQFLRASVLRKNVYSMSNIPPYPGNFSGNKSKEPWAKAFHSTQNFYDTSGAPRRLVLFGIQPCFNPNIWKMQKNTATWTPPQKFPSPSTILDSTLFIITFPKELFPHFALWRVNLAYLLPAFLPRHWQCD